jgi:tight adherence protein C
VDPLLLSGLALVFVAAALTLSALVLSPGGSRRDVARTLAAVRAVPPVSANRTGVGAPRFDPALDPAVGAARARELAEPFAVRVIGPLLTRCTALGRRCTPTERIQGIRRRLDLAGNPPGWDADRIIGVKAFGALVGFLLCAVLPPAVGAGIPTTVALGVLGGGVGWAAPSIWLYQVAYERSQQIRRCLADGLDLLTISVESGLAFDAAVSQVARKTRGPLAQEFSRVLQEMQIGTGRTQALRALAERTDVPELHSFISAMLQADTFGIPVSKVLRVQAREIRIKRRQRAEEAAQKVPVKILFPLVFCILPSLFVVIMGPAVISMISNLRGL